MSLVHRDTTDDLSMTLAQFFGITPKPVANKTTPTAADTAAAALAATNAKENAAETAAAPPGTTFTSIDTTSSAGDPTLVGGDTATPTNATSATDASAATATGGTSVILWVVFALIGLTVVFLIHHHKKKL